MNKKKIIMKIAAIGMVIMMAAAFGGCGNSEKAISADDSGSDAVVNPLHSCEESDLAEKTGIGLKAPENAQCITYSYIDGGEEGGDQPISQVEFVLDENEYCFRAQITECKSIMETVDGETADANTLKKSLDDATNVGAVLAGMYYEWENAATVVVSDMEGVCAFNEGKEGLICWLDTDAGIMYSLSVNQNATEESLIETAEQCMQALPDQE